MKTDLNEGLRPKASPWGRVMIDCETLGTTPGCVVATIGAVRFAGGRITDEFYVRIDLEDCVRCGLKMEVDTMRWWMQQFPKEREEVWCAKQKTNGPGMHGLGVSRLSLGDSLALLRGWLDSHEVTEIWCKGGSFDFPILMAAWTAAGYDDYKPWSYRKERCYRTVAALCPEVEAAQDCGGAHHALTDAIAQALHLMRVEEHWRQLRDAKQCQVDPEGYGKRMVETLGAVVEGENDLGVPPLGRNGTEKAQ